MEAKDKLRKEGEQKEETVGRLHWRHERKKWMTPTPGHSCCQKRRRRKRSRRGSAGGSDWRKELQPWFIPREERRPETGNANRKPRVFNTHTKSEKKEVRVRK